MDGGGVRGRGGKTSLDGGGGVLEPGAWADTVLGCSVAVIRILDRHKCRVVSVQLQPASWTALGLPQEKGTLDLDLG